MKSSQGRGFAQDAGKESGGIQRRVKALKGGRKKDSMGTVQAREGGKHVETILGEDRVGLA